jgi:L-iditol 2-dehydrogenase
MRALVCEAPGDVKLKVLPEPRPDAGEVVVRVGAALTCGTDLKMIRRGHPKVPFPMTLGHEFAGIVHSADPGAAFGVGERVTSAVSGPCGHCGECAQGRENLCSTAFETPLWGAFAEYVRVPARVVRRGLRAIPSTLPFTTAALLDPLASVLHALTRLSLMPDSAVVLYGCGPIALLFGIVLRRTGVTRVFAVGRRPSRLAALRRLGIEAIDRTATSVRASVRDATAGHGADVVIDTTGDASLVPDLFELAARGGTVLLFAGSAGGSRIAVDPMRIHYDEVTLAGSFHYTQADADAALVLLSSDAIPVDEVVTSLSRLDEYEAVFDRARRGEGMKTAFLP